MTKRSRKRGRNISPQIHEIPLQIDDLFSQTSTCPIDRSAPRDYLSNACSAGNSRHENRLRVSYSPSNPRHAKNVLDIGAGEGRVSGSERTHESPASINLMTPPNERMNQKPRKIAGAFRPVNTLNQGMHNSNNGAAKNYARRTSAGGNRFGQLELGSSRGDNVVEESPKYITESHGIKRRKVSDSHIRPTISRKERTDDEFFDRETSPSNAVQPPISKSSPVRPQRSVPQSTFMNIHGSKSARQVRVQASTIDLDADETDVFKQKDPQPETIFRHFRKSSIGSSSQPVILDESPIKRKRSTELSPPPSRSSVGPIVVETGRIKTPTVGQDQSETSPTETPFIDLQRQKEELAELGNGVGKRPVQKVPSPARKTPRRAGVERTPPEEPPRRVQRESRTRSRSPDLIVEAGRIRKSVQQNPSDVMPDSKQASVQLPRFRDRMAVFGEAHNRQPQQKQKPGPEMQTLNGLCSRKSVVQSVSEPSDDELNGPTTIHAPVNDNRKPSAVVATKSRDASTSQPSRRRDPSAETGLSSESEAPNDDIKSRHFNKEVKGVTGSQRPKRSDMEDDQITMPLNEFMTKLGHSKEDSMDQLVYSKKNKAFHFDLDSVGYLEQPTLAPALYTPKHFHRLLITDFGDPYMIIAKGCDDVLSDGVILLRFSDGKGLSDFVKCLSDATKVEPKVEELAP